MIPVQLVIQEEETGCGLACVVMLAGKQYAQVKELATSLDIVAEDPRLWSKIAYIRQLLAAYGLGTVPEENPSGRLPSPGKGKELPVFFKFT